MSFSGLKASTGSTPGSPSNNNSLKIVWQDEIRRLPFNPTGDFQSFKDLCGSCFGIKNMANLMFTYEDSEGDTVTLSSAEELRELVESSIGAIKLHLQRKVNKSKPQVQVTQDQAQPEPAKQVETEHQDQAQAQPEKQNKKEWKEKKQQLKKEIVHSKVIRLRWRAAPSTKQTEEKQKKKGGDKGCFVGANMKGKIHFAAGNQGKNGLWLIHELSNGDIILAPVCSPHSHLRVYPDGTTNLTEKGAGVRARWSLVNSEDKSNIGLASLMSNTRVELVSRFVPGLKVAAVQDFNKKTKPVLRAKGVESSAVAIASEFVVEVEDPMKSLVKFAKNVSCKKAAIKKALDRKQEKKAAEETSPEMKRGNKKNWKGEGWKEMSKQERMNAKAARKFKKMEEKRLKMAMKM